MIKRLSVVNVRSHESRKIELSPHVTVVTGRNGAGKTTLLEAIYVLLQGSSFKGSDKDLLRHNAPWYRIDLMLDDDSVRTVAFDPSKASGKKKFIIDDKTSYRLSPKHKYPIVLFEPEDLRLLHGSPSRRRLFLDRFITQIDPTYSSILRKYERALKQRNTLLKDEYATENDLFAWNVSLSEYGAQIMNQRKLIIERIDKTIEQDYYSLSQVSDVIAVTYSYADEITPGKLLRDLEESYRYDKVVGYTSVGPHRHDMTILFNNSPALSVASRGEVRTILLALKKIEVAIITELTGRPPVILLDDVFSELDSSRQQYIITFFSNNQVIISSATKHADNDFLHIEL